jgi:SAM-dependent MidA family methyltransferase
MWEILGRPHPFSLVEMGAGQGILATHILNYLQLRYPDFFAALDYVIVEKSLSLRTEQQHRLRGFPVHWCDLEEIRVNSITGCFFSNELFDALPVHLFSLAGGELQEVYVTTPVEALLEHPPRFIEVIGELSTPQLAEYFQLVKIDLDKNLYPDGYRSEINLAALSLLSIVADCLDRGYVLTIDYGYPALRYYHPRRSLGTLQCYYHHRYHNNPYIHVGRQDITAHVDFTALEQCGEQCGLHPVGWIQQGLFLMALGLGDRLVALSQQEQSVSELLQRRDALHQLINPTGLGNFGVLVQSKGLKPAESLQKLKGLDIPGES